MHIHGQAIPTEGAAFEALIETHWHAKTERTNVTQALYRSVVELENVALVEAFARRVDTATTAMLASASDAKFADLEGVTLALVS